MKIDPRAGQPAPPEMLMDVAALIRAYFTDQPDPSIPAQRVAFGTSGHRGTAFARTFNEHHVLAITQAICRYRVEHGTSGPLYLGADTHALSAPAVATALEVLAANGVNVMLSQGDEPTPTPVVSHAILSHNLGSTWELADGIVVTPSHNPPEDGGFKYNPPNGGPADTDVTAWVQRRANVLLRKGNVGVKRMPYASAVKAASTHEDDLVVPYVEDLKHVVDMDAIRAAGLTLGVDPLGGAALPYWEPINAISWIPPLGSCPWTGTAASAWTPRRPTPCSG